MIRKTGRKIELCSFLIERKGIRFEEFSIIDDDFFMLSRSIYSGADSKNREKNWKISSCVNF